MTVTERYRALVRRVRERYRLWTYIREARTFDALTRQSTWWENEFKRVSKENEKQRQHIHELGRQLYDLKEHRMEVVNWHAMHMIARGLYNTQIRLGAGSKRAIAHALHSHGAVIEFLHNAEKLYATTSRGEQGGVNREDAT